MMRPVELERNGTSRGGAGLLERANAERDREVAALFDRHYVPMCRLAFVILGDRALAEEIVMEALLKTFAGWGRLRAIDRADAYLRRAVVNLCRSRIRRKMIEARVNAETKARASRTKPDWDQEAHENNRLVMEAIRSLPERQRTAIVLRYYDDLSESQIAEVLDCSVGTVKSQLSKARSKLGAALEVTMSGGMS